MEGKGERNVEKGERGGGRDGGGIL